SIYFVLIFFFTASPPSDLSPLSLHDALPIWSLTFSRNCDHALSWRSFQTLTADCALFWSVSAFRNISATSSSRARSAPTNPTPRSEEHTSELQSLRHLVCRLLLEKKKTKKIK